MIVTRHFDSLHNSYVSDKKLYTTIALSLIEQCKNIVELTETLEKIEIQNTASDTSYILRQIREVFKQIAKTWVSYIKKSKAPLGSGILFKQEKDIPEEDYHKEVFRWITDKTSEIEGIIQNKLGIIVEGMSARRSEISQLQARTSEFSANGILELQKQRLTVLEESIVKVTLRNTI